MLRNKKGVSLITLIITIIVVIILAVIVMRGTGGTIEQANYSSYMDDLGKVKEAVKTKAMEVKGEYLIDGRVVSMEEIYHYVAKGGKTGEDFVGKVNVPDYTIIDRVNADIGIEIPTRNIESGTGRNVQIQYIVTKEGEVFAWPPYEYEDKLYITENITVAGKLDKNVQIEDESFTLDLDATLGTVLPTEETSGGGTGDEGDDNQGGSVTPNPELEQIDVGEYVIYNSDKGDIECRVWEKKENGDIVIMPTNPVGSLTLGPDSSKTYQACVASAATSYLNATTTVTNLCKEYISKELGVEENDILSLTLDELNKKTGYKPSIINKYAYYPSGMIVSGTTTASDGLVGYTKASHPSTLYNRVSTQRFYTFDYAKNTTTDEEGNIYAYPTETDPVFVTQTFETYIPNTVSDETAIYGNMLGVNKGWLASSNVICTTNDSYFSVRHIVPYSSNTILQYHPMCYSNAYTFVAGSYGVRPLITLSASLNLNSSVSGMDGSSSNPWRLTK